MAIGTNPIDLPVPTTTTASAARASTRQSTQIGAIARPYLFLLPALVTMGLFAFWPLAATVYNSFFQWNMVTEHQPVGWENYETILTDPSFRSLLQQSALYVLLSLISAFLLPVGLALLTMQVGSKAGALYQSVLFVPAVISTTVGAIVWQFLFLQRGGPLNAALTSVGLEPQAWLNDPRLALPSLGLVSAWKFLGFNYIIALAGVAGLPREQLEAARIDGAQRWSMLKDVILPLMAPTLLFIGLTAILQALPNVFVPIQLMTVGGPSGSSSNLLYAVYEDAFRFFQIGRSSARSVILVLILGGFAIWQFRLLEKRASYE